MEAERRSRQLDPGSIIGLAFPVRVDGVALPTNLLTFQNAADPIPNPPYVATWIFLPDSGRLHSRSAWHSMSCQHTVAKYHHKHHQHFLTRRSLSGREALVFAIYSFCVSYLGAGGGRTPTGRSPADFEFPENTVNL